MGRGPRTRIVHVDPIIHVIAPPGRPDLKDATLATRNSMYEAWDMLRGSQDPELGGDPKYLDIIGVNYYHSNQWEYLSNDRLHWHLGENDHHWHNSGLWDMEPDERGILRRVICQPYLEEFLKAQRHLARQEPGFTIRKE